MYTCVAGTAYLSGVPKFTPVFSEVRVAWSFIFCVVFCISLFVLLVFVFSVLLRCTVSVCPFGIFNFVFLTGIAFRCVVTPWWVELSFIRNWPFKSHTFSNYLDTLPPEENIGGWTHVSYISGQKLKPLNILISIQLSFFYLFNRSINLAINMHNIVVCWLRIIFKLLYMNYKTMPIKTYSIQISINSIIIMSF